jgi:hypothetical protein
VKQDDFYLKVNKYVCVERNDTIYDSLKGLVDANIL